MIMSHLYSFEDVEFLLILRKRLQMKFSKIYKIHNVLGIREKNKPLKTYAQANSKKYSVISKFSL